MFAYVRKSPTRALASYEPTYQRYYYPWFSELERWAEELWEAWRPTEITGLMPRTDILESKKGWTVKVELPGIKKEDIYVGLEGNYLVVKAEKKAEKETKDKTYYSCERSYGQYYRRISLPYPVYTDQLTASYENGVLEIYLPWTEKAEARQYEVKVK